MKFRSLEGQVAYADAAELQRELVELRARDEIEDTVLFLEHAPVITRGRGLQFTGDDKPRAMPLPEKLPKGIDFRESERGGDLTYHGPGQLVVYPILKLKERDVAGYIRKLERILIDELASLGLHGAAREGATGVWIGDRKVASIGIAVRKWVTWHGIAINVVNDLAPFHLISPCGFSPEVMTRLTDLLPSNAIPSAWRPWLEERLKARFAAPGPVTFKQPVV
jgi:lipoate-protein ligase B